MDREALPLLLRGAGTLLLLLASALALYQERGATHAPRSAAPAAARMGEGGLGAGDAAGQQRRTLAAEADALGAARRDDEFADRVLENPAFQLLGLLGTLVIAGSFFVEAAQKTRRNGALPPSPE